MSRKTIFTIQIDGRQLIDRQPVALAISASSPGQAARLAFRELIRGKRLARQPASTPEGGWDGVTIQVSRPASAGV